MMNKNKILTVSYDTFSCTLEGFDDPIDTMKEIADFFQDLAASDTKFGVEPSQPDSEVTSDTTRREASRRPKAREHEDPVMQRARDEDTQGASIQ